MPRTTAPKCRSGTDGYDGGASSNKPSDFLEPKALHTFLVFAAAAMFALVCGACLVLATFPFSWYRSLVAGAIPAVYHDRFGPALYAQVVRGLSGVGVLCGLSAVCLLRIRRAVARAIPRWWGDVAILCRTLIHNFSLRQLRPVTRCTLLAILVAGVALRFAFLYEPVRKDEGYSFVYYAVRPLYIGLSYYTANNHLLNTLLMHVSAAVFGMKPWAIRLPVFLAGSMIPLLTFAAVRKLHGTGAALIAAGLIAGSSPLIEYSVNARGYSLAAAFIMLSILLSAIALKDGLRGAWMMLPVGAALALYSVPVTLYGVAGLFATFLALDRRHTLRWLAAMTATGAITTVLYSPVLLSVGLRAITANQWVAPLPAEVWPQAFRRELRSLFAYWSMDMPAVVVVVVLAGVLLTIALAMRHRRLPALLLCLGVTCIAAIALCWFQQVVPPRRSWLYILPLFFSCAAIGLAGIAGRVSRRREAVAAGMAAVLTCAMAFDVLRNQTLTSHSGLERVGLRSAPDIIQGIREPLARGGTFICADYFDSSLDFELRAQGVRYQPSDSGPLIIVAPAGGNATSILGKAGISESQISELRFVRRFADADVYLATRMPGLRLPPGGTTEAGMFTSAYQQ